MLKKNNTLIHIYCPQEGEIIKGIEKKYLAGAFFFNLIKSSQHQQFHLFLTSNECCNIKEENWKVNPKYRHGALFIIFCSFFKQQREVESKNSIAKIWTAGCSKKKKQKQQLFDFKNVCHLTLKLPVNKHKSARHSLTHSQTLNLSAYK